MSNVDHSLHDKVEVPFIYDWDFMDLSMFSNDVVNKVKKMHGKEMTCVGGEAEVRKGVKGEGRENDGLGGGDKQNLLMPTLRHC